jgi:hypothetical protein
MSSCEYQESCHSLGSNCDHSAPTPTAQAQVRKPLRPDTRHGGLFQDSQNQTLRLWSGEYAPLNLSSFPTNMAGVVPQAITNEYAAEGVRPFNATTGCSALLQS